MLKLKWSLLPGLRDLPAHPRETHSHREGWHLLPLVLPERGQFQRGAGGAPSDEEGVRERGCGPTGPDFSQIQCSAGTNWLTQQNKRGSRKKSWTLLSLLVRGLNMTLNLNLSACVCTWILEDKTLLMIYFTHNELRTVNIFVVNIFF